MGGHPRDVCSRLGGRGRHGALRCRGVVVRARRRVRAVPDLRQRALALRAAPGGHRSPLPCRVRRPNARSKDAAAMSCDPIPTHAKEQPEQSTAPAGRVRRVQFSRKLRDDVLAGDITLSVRLWKRPQVKEGGRYRVGPGVIEVDAIELVPFAAITEADVERAGEPDRETLRDRAAHAGPIDDDTLVYRIELHAVKPGE